MAKVSEAELAFFRGVARQLSPFIRQMFHEFALEHGVDFYDVYLIFRYRTNEDLQNIDNHIMELRILGKKEVIEDLVEFSRDSINKEDLALIRTMLPMFAADISDQAAHLGQPITSMFVHIKVQQGQNSKADTARIMLRCTKRKDWDYPVLDTDQFEI
jgi:hypothetical protein